MGAKRGHLIGVTYDDVHKFEWCAVLERETGSLWLDAVGVCDAFGLPPDALGPAQSLVDFDIARTVGACTDEDQLRLCPADAVLNARLPDPVVNANYRLVVHRYLYHQLPMTINTHLGVLGLKSLYDVKQFEDRRAYLAHMLKYWLFRYKVLIMPYEQNVRAPVAPTPQPHAPCVAPLHDAGPGAELPCTRGPAQQDDAEVAPQNFCKNFFEPDFGVDFSGTISSDGARPSETPAVAVQASEIVRGYAADREGGNETTKNVETTDLLTEMVDNLKHTILLQFGGLNRHDEEARLHVDGSFLELLMGAVGLLEELLVWQ